jgi:NAD(P)-dependent dehydrogenase (short-subunit alcohol dehydrogenase family)
MNRLEGKVIIVTGSTTGIGEAIARRCVEEGARVLVHGREAEAGMQVVDSLGGRAVFHKDDLADPAAPARIVAAAVEAFGRLDGLVNNAAYVVRGRIGDVTVEFFDSVMAVNVRAPLLLIQAALPHLEKSRGAVVNIGSVNAYCGEENLLPYSISKGALMTLSRNLGDSLTAAMACASITSIPAGCSLRTSGATSRPKAWQRTGPRNCRSCLPRPDAFSVLTKRPPRRRCFSATNSDP